MIFRHFYDLIINRAGAILVTVVLILPAAGCEQVKGQDRTFFHSFGMDFGMTSTNLFSNSGSTATQFRFHGRHMYNGELFGELDLGIGFMVRDAYESRFLPVEYRVSRRLDHITGLTPAFPNTYAYVGAGVIHFQRLGVGVQDDPKLIESDEAIRNSSLWGHGSGLSYQLPVGLEMFIPLPSHSSIRIRGGYNIVGGSVHQRKSVMDGYWGLTIGLSARPKPAPAPYRSSRPVQLAAFPQPVFTHRSEITSTASINPAVNNAYPTLYNVTMPILYFETLHYQLSEQDHKVLDQTVDALQRWPELHIEIEGFADPRGTVAMNRSLSHMRFWKIKEYLLQRGIPVERISGYGSGAEVLPIVHTGSEEEIWAMNRRAEIRITTTPVRKSETETETRGTNTDVMYPPQNHRLLLPADALTFSRESDELSGPVRDKLDAVADYLRKNTETALSIDGYSEKSGQPRLDQLFADSRAVRVADYLIGQGISYRRLLIQERVIPGDVPDGIREPRERRPARRVEIVLVNSDGEDVNE